MLYHQQIIQKKYGKLRITDTGIRESSIIGQGIGAALMMDPRNTIV